MLDPAPIPKSEEFIGYLVDACHIFQQGNAQMLRVVKNSSLRSTLLARGQVVAYLILFLNMELVDRGSKKILQWGKAESWEVLPDDMALKNLKRCMYVRRARKFKKI